MPSDTPPPSTESENGAHHGGFWTLALGSVGVVYGDIGTSPLYALREALHVVKDGGVGAGEVLGVISLLLWALIIVVTLKYVVFLMQADNKGEGGILSLMALAKDKAGKFTGTVFICGMAGAALFYGDAILTPAISVLSAVEGIKLVTPIFEPYVVPITLAILIGLFLAQSHGTGKVAMLFGPITLVWFFAIAACAIPHIARYPEVLLAFSPHYGAQFLMQHWMTGLFVLGAVFLAVTGAEALYADMGHFGKGPIRLTWAAVIFPSLAINYLGQGALILHNPAALENPFFLLAPEWALIPMVILATVATVIASQAVITGAFSLTRQAIQLGLLPRLEIRHTSETQSGQIYMPQINAILLIGVIILVMEFKSSSALASAYGIAVSATMLVDTFLAFLVVWKVWNKPAWLAAAIALPFVCIDTTFFSANLLKLFEGGYIPVTLAACMVVLMWTWRRGSRYLMEKSRKASLPLHDFIGILEKSRPARVPGLAVFLTSEPDVVPTAFMHNLKHNKVMHETNVIMTANTSPTPKVPESQRISMEKLTESLARVTIHFGYMETPNVPLALAQCRRLGLKFDIMSTSFFLNRRSIKAANASGLPAWQDALFIMMARNATNATDFFHIPPGRVVEMGAQITI